jgi:hypothetical protein
LHVGLLPQRERDETGQIGSKDPMGHVEHGSFHRSTDAAVLRFVNDSTSHYTEVL